MGLTGNWDTRISRRALLRGGGAATAAYVLLGRGAMSQAAPPFSGNPFALGVASGDPTPDGVVLWTRLAPSSLTSGTTPGEGFGVRFELAEDEEFRRIVQRGAAPALAEEAHSVHAEIGGLRPATPYWYRFKWGPTVSPVGRTRTAPAPDSTDPMRFAFASCQNYTNGFFSAYADMAQQDLDLVVHLGDYIYEGPGVGVKRVRDHLPRAELFSLADYRARHAQYKTDPDLRAAPAAFQWLPTWDDHEFKDNYADLDLDTPEVPLETIAQRRAAAYQAYWEHMPLSRARKPIGPDMPLYRRAQWGALATFHVLDTRQYRSNQISTCTPAQRDPASGYCPDALDPARGMLGPTQREWLMDGLAGATTRWNVLANQVGFTPMDTDRNTARRGFNRDNWDGYVAERQALLDLLKGRGIANAVVITGDAHENSVSDVPPDFHRFDGTPVATEFMGTSISSEGDDPAGYQTSYRGDPQNPHRLFSDFHRGYSRVTLDQGRWTNEFRVVDSVTRRPAPPGHTLATFVVEHGHPGALPL
jgi:alkaline phosphatase D